MMIIQYDNNVHTYYTVKYILYYILFVHMTQYEIAPEHRRVRLRKRHKSPRPRYASSTVCPRSLYAVKLQ